MQYILAALVAFLVLFHGGFYGYESAAAGIVAAIALGAIFIKARLGKEAKPANKEGILLVPTLFFLLAVAYLLSALVNGLTLTSLSETGQWFAVALISAAAAGLTGGQKDKLFTILALFGLVSAVFGIILFSGVMALSGTMSNGRLQFTFQYANTAGIWFVIVAALLALSEKKALRYSALVPVVALLCTQSGGAIAVGAITLVGALALNAKRVRTRNSYIAFGASALALVVAVVVAQVLAASRIDQALQDFAIRFVYDVDALVLMAQSPLVGTGPDSWQYLYQGIQSAQYRTSTIHCSYLQIATDAGLLGLALFLAAIAFGIKDLVKSPQSPLRRKQLIILFALLAHSLVDFDLQFAALAFMLVIALSSERGARIALPITVTFVAKLALCAVCLVCCVGALWSSLTLNQMNENAHQGNLQDNISLYRATPLAQSDIAARNYYVVALYSSGRHQEAVAAIPQDSIQSDEQALVLARSLQSLGKQDQAVAVLVGRIKNMPYNDGLMQSAYNLFKEWKLSEDQKAEYNEAIKAAQVALGQGLAANMPDQRPVKGLLL